MTYKYTGHSNIQLLRWLLYWSVLLLLLFLATVPILVTLVLLDKVAPARWVSVVFPSMGAAWLFLICLLLIRGRKLGEQLKPRSPFPATRQLIAVIFILALIALAILLGLRFHKSAQDSALLGRAQQHFSVIAHEPVSRQRVESTLIELEGEYAQLRERYELSIAGSPIEINLYPNVRQYELATKKTGSLGYTTCSEYGPIIYLPVEYSDDQSSEQFFQSTPEHEMVHAVICDLIGLQRANTVPLWFHEGLAEYESLKGMSNVLERLGYRWYLWRHKSERMLVDEFMSATSIDLGPQRRVFIGSYYEFMRYLTNKFGEQSPWNILKKVAQGETFDMAFKHVTNSDLTHEYEEWLLDY